MERGASAHFQAGDKGAVAVRVEQRGALWVWGGIMVLTYASEGKGGPRAGFQVTERWVCGWRCHSKTGDNTGRGSLGKVSLGRP